MSTYFLTVSLIRSTHFDHVLHCSIPHLWIKLRYVLDGIRLMILNDWVVGQAS